MTPQHVGLETSLAKNICTPGKFSGTTRDFLKRYLISRDQFWWKKMSEGASPWQINLVHDWTQIMEDPVLHQKVEPYKVSYWRDRVLDLCEYEITHQCFGMGFKDLMELDPATFEDIEERVHAIAQRKNEDMKQLEGKTSENNLLKEPRR